jgi:hypothetical protein
MSGQAGAGAGAAAAAGAGAGAGAVGAAGAGAGNASGAGAAAGGSVLAPAPAPIHEVIPEKYRVMAGEKADQFDLEQSARKLAAGYGELSQRLGAGEAPPSTPDEYNPGDIEGGLKFEDLKKDPETANWLKSAHALGMTNKQVKHVFDGLSKLLVDQAAGDAALSAEQATAELRKLWKTDQEFTTNRDAAVRAVNAFAPKVGVDAAELIRRYGNDPTFIRFAAALGAEIREDAPVGGNAPAPVDFDAQVKAIDEQLSKLPGWSPERPALVEKKLALFEAKHGKKRVGIRAA